MVGIGINENVVITNETKVNDKGTLELYFKQAKMTSAQMIAASLGGNDVDDKSSRIMYFAPNSVLDYNKVPKTAAQVLKEIQEFRRHLNDILVVFVPSDVLAVEFGPRLPLEVTGVEPEQFEKQLSSDSSIAAIGTKIAQKFVALCIQYKVFDNSIVCRVKLTRQKLANTYSDIPKFGAWIEPMDVPEPKVIASKYDLTDYDAVKYPGIHKLSNQPLPADIVPKEEESAATNMFENKDEFPSEDMDKPLFTD